MRQSQLKKCGLSEVYKGSRGDRPLVKISWNKEVIRSKGGSRARGELHKWPSFAKQVF